ncbi:MAG: hypothetical protein BGN86_16790 [Caulobacterales bacterium 68-7]|nr:MAG: hypothetical protein BGN86_16790 [Caulobacterales bacterium 68-7]
MPLLMCPNDNAPMQILQRGGVEFDMCPTCRGVWLDRGELEKLMAINAENTDRPVAQPWQQDAAREAQQRFENAKRYDDDRKRYDERYDKHGRAKKKGGFDLFDIFD